MDKLPNLQPLQQGLLGGGSDIPKDIISGPFNYAEQNGCIKIFHRMCLEKDG